MGKNKQPQKGSEDKDKNKGSSGKTGGAPIKGAKMKASHIVVPKLSQAQQIYDKLQAGEKFEDLALQFSNCPSKKRGGNLGEFTKGMFHNEFWEACAKLRIGEISEPVKSPSGYHIIKRTG
jgi:parvulin-like peptidyl-prolyl isomerase